MNHKRSSFCPNEGCLNIPSKSIMRQNRENMHGSRVKDLLTWDDSRNRDHSVNSQLNVSSTKTEPFYRAGEEDADRNDWK